MDAVDHRRAQQVVASRRGVALQRSIGGKEHLRRVTCQAQLNRSLGHDVQNERVGDVAARWRRTTGAGGVGTDAFEAGRFEEERQGAAAAHIGLERRVVEIDRRRKDAQFA